MKVNAMEQKYARIKVVVNNDGNMDRGTKGSLVMSLSQKTIKTLALVNKLHLRNLQNYKRTAILIMQQESKRFNCAGNTTK